MWNKPSRNSGTRMKPGAGGAWLLLYGWGYVSELLKKNKKRSSNRNCTFARKLLPGKIDPFQRHRLGSNIKPLQRTHSCWGTTEVAISENKMYAWLSCKFRGNFSTGLRLKHRQAQKAAWHFSWGHGHRKRWIVEEFHLRYACALLCSLFYIMRAHTWRIPLWAQTRKRIWCGSTLSWAAWLSEKEIARLGWLCDCMASHNLILCGCSRDWCFLATLSCMQVISMCMHVVRISEAKLQTLCVFLLSLEIF
jgi:hypothetical protein